MTSKKLSQGLVHSVESCGVFDGPGIRAVIFLQGCYLRCLYCHNPDTWDLKGGATGMSVGDLIERLEPFKPFMNQNQGGVTISGGEPMIQKHFLSDLIPALKAEGYHTCIDTNGMIPVDEEMEDILATNDLILLDIKDLNPERHLRLTGKSNERPLGFLRHLAETSRPVWIRHVVVPGWTDDESDHQKMAEFLKQYENIERVELLPFHRMGVQKYKDLGMADPLPETQPPDPKAMKVLRGYYVDAGLPIVMAEP